MLCLKNIERKLLNIAIFNEAIKELSLKYSMQDIDIINLFIETSEEIFNSKMQLYCKEDNVYLVKIENQNTHKKINLNTNTLKKILNEIDETSKKIEDNKLQLTFAKLEILFIKQKKEDEKETQKIVKETTWTKWQQVFNDLKIFFDVKNLEDITLENLKDFRKSLIEKGLSPLVINEKIMYLRIFLDFAILKKHLKDNKAKELEDLFVKEKVKELFDENDLKKLFDSVKIGEDTKNIFKILLYTGMRIHEFFHIKSENILIKNGINYLKLEVGKGKNGLREIPIHREILHILKNFDFENLRKEYNVSSFSKIVLANIYREIPKSEEKKTTHTFRANFTNQLINNFPSEINLIQSILGHTQGTKKLTIIGYGKGFDLKNKKRLIDSIKYDF